MQSGHAPEPPASVLEARAGRHADGRITVTVRLFAELRERAGVSRVDVRVRAGEAAEGVWPALPPALSATEPPRSLAFAVNHTWADPSTPLADGDQLALLLPGSGG